MPPGDAFAARLRTLLREAQQNGLSPDDILDSLLCGCVSIGEQHALEPEAVLFDLRLRWSAVRALKQATPLLQ